jgi:hypothetical protein
LKAISRGCRPGVPGLDPRLMAFNPAGLIVPRNAKQHEKNRKAVPEAAECVTTAQGRNEVAANHEPD